MVQIGIVNPFIGSDAFGDGQVRFPMLLTAPDDQIEEAAELVQTILNNDWVEVNASGILIIPNSCAARIYIMSNWRRGYGVGSR